MSKSKELSASLVVVLLAFPVLAGAWYLAFKSRPLPAVADSSLNEDRRSESITVGGAKRSLAEMEPSARVAELKKRARSGGPVNGVAFDDNDDPIGRSPIYRGNENASLAMVAEAVRTRSHPERITPMIMPKPFDPESYQADPTNYLQAVEPGRVWQAAQPGPGVPEITAASQWNPTIKQGESIRLSVTTAPNAPVTFTSFDLGGFENLATSITVAANSEGVASAAFTGTRGTVGNTNVLAAGPMSSGQVHFLVHILPRGK